MQTRVSEIYRQIIKQNSGPATAMREPSGEDIQLLLILDLGTRRSEWSASRLTSSGRDLQYPLDRRLGGPQSWSGHGGWGKILCLCRRSNLCRPVSNETLYWQRYLNSITGHRQLFNIMRKISHWSIEVYPVSRRKKWFSNGIKPNRG
jgi:hypothetical protein